MMMKSKKLLMILIQSTLNLYLMKEKIELSTIFFKKIDGIANSNSEIISKIEFLNSKKNAIEQKLNPIERNNVVKDSNNLSY